MKAMRGGLKELRADIRETNFLLLIYIRIISVSSRTSPKISRQYTSTSQMLIGSIFWEDFANFARSNGFPEKELQVVPHSHPGYKFKSKEQLSFHMLKEDNTISISEYIFKCVEKPGHTRVHMCLYEPHKKIFVAGNHILSDITAPHSIMV